MELREGYKETEIGILPEDWEVAFIGDLFTFKNGLNKAKEFFGYGIPIVNYMDVFLNRFIDQKELKGKVFLNASEIKNFEIRKGDVFFTRTSEIQEEIGMTSVIDEDPISSIVFSGFLLRARPVKDIFLSSYLGYGFLSHSLRKSIISTSSYTTRALTNGRLLSNLLIPIPPKPEQTAITTALRDIDKLITTTQALIAKKKAIKTATMQQLLTPKDDWVEMKLGDVAYINMGQSPSSKYYNYTGNGLPLVQGNADILNRKTIIRSYSSNVTKKALKNDIIFTVRAPVGNVALTSFDCCIGRGVCSIRYRNLFIYYYLINIEKYWTELSSGSTFDSINSNELKEFKIWIPNSEDKENEITDSISLLFVDIDNIETILDKYQSIKQGMMQNLLTGKIRLI